MDKYIPILMYHRIADDGPLALEPYRISPDVFESQLKYLQQNGYKSVGMDYYCSAILNGEIQLLKDNLIVLTFDDAYIDFYETAWPLLEKYGFSATVYVPTNFVGLQAQWDNEFGTPAKIMSWVQIQELSLQGVDFQAHSCNHVRLTKISLEEATIEIKQSKLQMEQRLKNKITGFCYPYCAQNQDIQTIVKSAGYEYAVGGAQGKSKTLYNLNRVEIYRKHDLNLFIKKLLIEELTVIN